MPDIAWRPDRRSLLIAAGNVGLAMVTVGGFAATDMVVRTPSLTFIGEEQAQFGLLRTRGAKLGVLFGPPTPKLLAAIVPLLGWTLPALDLLALSPAALTEPAASWLATQTHIRSLLVLGPSAPIQHPSFPTGVPARMLTEPAVARLSHGVTVEFRPAYPVALFTDSADDVRALIAIRRQAQTIVMLDDLTALTRQPGITAPTLLAVPAGDLRQTIATVRPGAIAINDTGTFDDRLVPAGIAAPDRPLGVLRTFINDPAVVTLATDGLRLPSWAQLVPAAPD